MEAAASGLVPTYAHGPNTKLPRVGSAVVVLNGGRVLLGTRDKEPNRGKLVLPGGKVRPFESIGDAARREIKEETGLEIEVECQLGVWEIIEPPSEHRLIVYSQARPIGGALQAASDLRDACFYRLDDIDSLDLTSTVRAVLERVVRER